MKSKHDRSLDIMICEICDGLGKIIGRVNGENEWVDCDYCNGHGELDLIIRARPSEKKEQ